MANSDIQLLFGVLGGGSLSGESGALIQSELTQIMDSLNKNPLKVKVTLDAESTKKTSWTAQLQKKLDALNAGNKLSVTISNIKLGTSAISSFKQQLGAVINTLNLDKDVSISFTSKDIGEITTQFRSAGDAAAEAARKAAEFKVQMEMLGNLKTSVQKSLSSLRNGNETEEEKARIAGLTTQYEQWAIKIEEVRASKTAASGTYRAELEAEGAAIQDNINKLHQERQAAADAAAAQQAEAKSRQAAEEAAKRAAEETIAAEEKARVTAAKRNILYKQISDAIVRIRKAQQDWTAAENGKSRTAYASLEKYIERLEDLRSRADNLSITKIREELTSINKEFAGTSNVIKAADENTKTLTGRIGNLANKFTSWLTVSQVIMQVYRALKQMVTAVIEVDTAMTELRKVTDETELTYSKFLDTAITRSKQLGATVTDTITASADFARLGHTLDEAAQLADAAIIYKNVGDGIEDIATASESIISTMKAFGIEAEDSMFIVDKFNEVGNNFAISSKGVGDALIRSASALAAGNNTLDESIALITAANSVVQDADKVGTTLKTVSMFLRAAKTEAEAAGESTEGMANSVSELRAEILALTGGKVDIQIDENTFKSTYQIMKELSEVWGELTDITQANILEMIGGKRNSNVVASLITNFKTAEEVMVSSANAAGSALAENEKYLDSIEGKISEFKATFQELAITLIDSDFVKQIVEWGTGLLNVLNAIAKVIDAVGGLNTVLFATAGIITAIKIESIDKMFTNIVTKINRAGSDVAGFFSIFADGFSDAKKAGKSFVSSIGAGLKSLTGLVSAVQLAIGALTLAITAAIIIYQKHKQKVEESRQAAQDAAQAYNEQKNSVSEYKDKIHELRDAIDKGNLSEQEAYNKRQELISIEESLIKMFGKEAEGIDLVTGSIDAQIDAIDRLSKAELEAEWKAYKQKNIGAIKYATNLFTDFDPKDLDPWNLSNYGGIRIQGVSMNDLRRAIKDLSLDITPRDFHDALQKELENADLGIKIPIGGLTGDTISQIEAESIYDYLAAYQKLYDITEKLGKEYFGENYLDYIGSDLAQYSTEITNLQSAIDDNEEIFNTYVEGLLNYDEQYSAVWGEILSAQKKYQDAILNGDDSAAEAALIAMQEAEAAFLNAGWDNDAVNLYVKEFFDSWNASTSQYKFKVQVKAELENDESAMGNLIKDAVRYFEDESGTVDLYRVSNVGIAHNNSPKKNDRRATLTDEEQAYVNLKFAAEEYEMTAEELVTLLGTLGYVTLSASADTQAAAKKIAKSFDALSSSAESAMEAQLALDGVFADNTHITEDAYKAMVELAGSEEALAGCIDTTNGYLVTNAAELHKVIDASNEVLLSNIKMARSHERLNYHNLVSELYDVCNGLESYDDASMQVVKSILDQIDKIELQIAKYKLLEQQVLGVTNAFTELSNAQALDEASDYTDDLSGMIDALIGSYENHEFGTETFKTAFDALIPEDIYEQFTDAGDQLDAGWKYLNEKLARYFTYDDGSISIDYSNVEKFVSDALSTSFGDSTVLTGTLENFDLNPQIDTVEEFAEAMGVTTEVAFALGNAISKYTADNADFLSSLDGENSYLRQRLEEFSQGGTVDLTLRPQIDTSELKAAGWDVEDGGIATTFTSTYSNEDETIAINFTPIITDENGKYIGCLSPAQLQEYAEGVIAGTQEDNLHLQIGAAFEGDNAIEQAVIIADKVHELQNQFYLGSLEQQIYDCDQAMTELLKKRAELVESGKIGADEWYELQAEIDETKSKMEELRSTARENISANIEIDAQITEKQKEVDSLKSDLDSLDETDAEYEATMTNYVDAQDQLATLLQQKYDLELPTELTIQVALEQVQQEITDTQDKLDTIAEYDAEAGVYVAIDPEDQGEVDNLVSQLAQLNDEYSQIQVYAGIDDEDVLTSLESIQNFVIENKEFSVTMSGYGTTKRRLDTVIKLLDDIQSKKNKTVTITTIHRDVGGSSGSTEAYGSARASGSAHIRGNWGIKSAEKDALVGELGTELVVDPNTGTYHTVGDNGAEFVNLPKGAIIFNHKQTEGLLKNRKINSRGKAFVEGNAHFTYLPGSYKFGTPTRVPSNNPSTAKVKRNNVTVNAELDPTNLEEQLKDTLEGMAEDIDEIIGNFEHQIFIMEKKGASTKEIIAIYEKMQIAVHEQAEKYRALGLNEESDYIQDLQKQWWEYGESIAEVRQNAFDDYLTDSRFAIDMMKADDASASDISRSYSTILKAINDEIAYYLSKGYDITDDTVQSLIQEAWNVEEEVKSALDNIVAEARDAIDELQDVYNTLSEAADEYAKYGYITVDSLQSIIDLGVGYMALLQDENGQLVVNKENIQKVIAARTEQLAVESALNYVEQLRLALEAGNTAELQRLLTATTNATNATWGLVYANLALLNLDTSQYAAALNNINAIRSLADNAIANIGASMSSSDDRQSRNEALQEQKDALDDILEYTMELIEWEAEQQVEALEQQVSDYEEIVELKKEMLKATKEEADYEDELADKIKAIAKLQERINALSLDDSREAKAERIALEEEMYGLQEELADYQADHMVEAQEGALDDMAEAYAAEKEKEIAAVEETVSSTEKIYKLAITRISSDWEGLHQDLLAYNYEYGNTIQQDLVNAWNAASLAVQEYGSYVNAVSGIDAALNTAEPGVHGTTIGTTGTYGEAAQAKNIVNSMRQNSIAYWAASDSERTAINSNQLELAQQYRDLTGDQIYSQNGSWYTESGNIMYSITANEVATAVVSRMKANSAAWGATQSASARSALERENEVLATRLASYLGANIAKNSETGEWYINGEKLYSKYHSGGIAGDIPTLKQDEVMAILQKGEAVLDKRREEGLFRLVDFVTNLSDRFGKLISSVGYNQVFQTQGAVTADELAALSDSKQTSVQFGDVYIYGANDETVEKHREVNRQFVNDVLKQLNIKR